MLEPGTWFDGYEIVAAIGTAGWGQCSARGTRFGRDLALKLLPEGFSHDPDRIARLRRGAEVLASLNQPDVGAIYELEQSRGAQAIVLELVKGETLVDRFQRARCRVRPARYGRQIAEALDAPTSAASSIPT